MSEERPQQLYKVTMVFAVRDVADLPMLIRLGERLEGRVVGIEGGTQQLFEPLARQEEKDNG